MTSQLSWRDVVIANNTPDRKISLSLSLMQIEQPSYSDFVNLIHRAIRLAIAEMTHHKNHLHTLGEDALSIVLLQRLGGMGFLISHGANNGGNTDLLIQGPDGFRWIAEAKLYTSYAKLFGGARQLVDRYSSGLPNEDRGAIIAYVTKPNASAIMAKWRAYLIRFIANLTAPAPNSENLLEFETSLFHAGAGRVLTVTHFAAPLYHSPTDPLSGPAPGKTAPIGLQ